LHDWGYEDILPPNQYHPVPLSTVAHIITGVIILVAGGAGGTFTFSLLRIHIRFRKTLLDSSGIFLCNFLFSNLLLAVLQCPFSGVSALIGSWIFGDFGCQLYAFVGFQVGIGMILCLLLIIIDVFLFATGSPFLSDNDKRSWILIASTWHAVFLFTAPPLLGVFGRYHLEPAGTSCTIDYWHGNFRNYNKMILLVMVFAYLIPISVMILLLIRIFRKLNPKKAKVIQRQQKDKKKQQELILHYQAMAKICFLLLAVQLLCWSPYACLVLYSLIFPPSSINIYLTIIPSLACKVAPILNSLVVWKFLPRLSEGGKETMPEREPLTN